MTPGCQAQVKPSGRIFCRAAPITVRRHWQLGQPLCGRRRMDLRIVPPNASNDAIRDAAGLSRRRPRRSGRHGADRRLLPPRGTAGSARTRGVAPVGEARAHASAILQVRIVVALRSQRAGEPREIRRNRRRRRPCAGRRQPARPRRVIRHRPGQARIARLRRTAEGPSGGG